ncbi:hypothetical protein N602_25770 [Mycobacterium avium subsp. hominissuis 10-5606]|nr:hypothetical protein N602_25770 [Mycobacterium avium subsp. hominissuis 10-5606]
MTRTAGAQTPERQAEVARAIAEMSDYFFELVAERRGAPRNDLFSLLTTVELDGERLTDIQIVNIAKVFLVGGNENNHVHADQRVAPASQRARAGAEAA